jgi:hypothetical protein
MTTRGTTLLTAFTPEQLDDVIATVQTGGRDVKQSVARLRSEQGVPAFFAMLPEAGEVPDEVVLNIMRGLFLVAQDFLAAQWGVEEFTKALTRGGGVNEDYARQIVTSRIVTPDTDLRGLMRKIGSWLPSIPIADQAIGGAVHLMENAFDALMPVDARNNSRDVLFELQNLGAAMKDMLIRGKLTRRESAYETMTMTDKPDESAVTTAAMSTIPMLGQALLRLLAARGAGVAGDIEVGDEDIGDLLSECGDLMDSMPPMESGDLFGWVSKAANFVAKAAAPVLRVAAPLAATALGGPVGGLLVGAGMNALLDGPSRAAIAQVARRPLRAGPMPRLSLPQLSEAHAALSKAKSLGQIKMVLTAYAPKISEVTMAT